MHIDCGDRSIFNDCNSGADYSLSNENLFPSIFLFSHLPLYRCAINYLKAETDDIPELLRNEYPKYYDKAQSFTVYGEACFDLCEKRGYSYYWCHKFEESSTGYWSTADVCTNDHYTTPYNEKCIDACEKRGASYFWCHKGSITWGYCTPKFLLDYLKRRRFSNERK